MTVFNKTRCDWKAFAHFYPTQTKNITCDGKCSGVIALIHDLHLLYRVYLVSMPQAAWAVNIFNFSQKNYTIHEHDTGAKLDLEELWYVLKGAKHTVIIFTNHKTVGMPSFSQDTLFNPHCNLVATKVSMENLLMAFYILPFSLIILVIVKCTLIIFLATACGQIGDKLSKNLCLYILHGHSLNPWKKHSWHSFSHCQFLPNYGLPYSWPGHLPGHSRLSTFSFFFFSTCGLIYSFRSF